MIKLMKRLVRRRRRKNHICAHAHVANVYRCGCGHTYVGDRR